MVLLTEPFPMLWAPVPFITDHGTSPRPKSWQTASCIYRPHPACGRRVRPETRCEGGAELFLCHQLAQQEVYPRYSPWEWHKEQVFCGQARKLSESQPILTILHFTHNYNNKYDTNNVYNQFTAYNYHSQDHRLFPTSTQGRIRKTWIQCLL